jgi:hypothetical protein
MATKLKQNAVYNTLDFAKEILKANLTGNKPRPSEFKTKEEVEAFLMTEFKSIMEHGDHSYDPTVGEITVSFSPDLDVSRKIDVDGMEDKMSIGEIVQTFFRQQGWSIVIIIPGRTGVHKTVVRLRNAEIIASELVRGVTRLSAAVDSLVKA